MQADSFFTIGSSHHVCEDYALSGDVDGRPFAVLSDGCSGSKHTDFGSRFLCLASRDALAVSAPGRFHRDSVLPIACSMVGKSLPWSCLDATAAVVYHDNVHLKAQVVGDGVVVVRHRDGSFRIHRISYSGGAPGYLTYLLDNNRYQQFAAGVAGAPGATRTVITTWWDSSFEGQLHEPAQDTSKVAAVPSDFWKRFCYPRQDFDLVAVFSDGVQTFECTTDLRGHAPVPLVTALQQLLDFKSMKGRFVTRRCRKFFRKFCVENAWSHHDDFAMAAIYDDETSEVL